MISTKKGQESSARLADHHMSKISPPTSVKQYQVHRGGKKSEKKLTKKANVECEV